MAADMYVFQSAEGIGPLLHCVNCLICLIFPPWIIVWCICCLVGGDCDS